MRAPITLLVFAALAGSVRAINYDVYNERFFETQGSADVPEFSMEAAWQNRYILEGRESFGENGAFTALASAGYRQLSLDLLTAFSDGSADREFEGILSWHFNTEPVRFAAGIVHINDMRGGDKDWDLFAEAGSEIALGISWNALLYYGINPGGAYFEGGLSRPFALSEGAGLTLAAHLGGNLGYIEDGHDGFDHSALEVRYSMETINGITLEASAAWFTPINDSPFENPADADLYDGLRVGLSASCSF